MVRPPERNVEMQSQINDTRTVHKDTVVRAKWKKLKMARDNEVEKCGGISEMR